MQIRQIEEKELGQLVALIENCRPLEVYPFHFYKIMSRYFNNTFIVAEESGKILGFALGIIAQAPRGSSFLWQIGVDSRIQAKGVGKRLLRSFEEKVEACGCRQIELTVDLDNIPSQKLFEKSGYKNVSKKKGRVVVKNDKPGAEDYYGPGRNFIIYEKILG